MKVKKKNRCKHEETKNVIKWLLGHCILFKVCKKCKAVTDTEEL
jgi:hypothetical protein